MKPKSFFVFAGGIALMVIGLFLLPIGVLERQNGSLIPASSLVFSLGALLVGAGFYLRVQAVKEELRPAQEAEKRRKDLLRTNGACPICGTNPALFRCKVHHAVICHLCLPTHDNSWCEYVPLTRRASASKKGAWR